MFAVYETGKNSEAEGENHMSEFLIGSKFYLEVPDRTASNLEQTEAEIQDHFQRICNLVMGRSQRLKSGSNHSTVSPGSKRGTPERLRP